MSCRVVDVGGGGTAFACSRGTGRQRAECQFCKARPATKLCDEPLTGKKAGKTCDGRMCESCTTRIGDIDLCPPHRRARDKRAELVRESDAEDVADAWLASMTKTTSQDAAVPWTSIADDPPATVLAAEVRARDGVRERIDAVARSMVDARPWDNAPSSLLDEIATVSADDRSSMMAARENAVIMSQRADTAGARACPRCGGHVTIVGNRAWCVKRFADGGCGGYWTSTDADRRRAPPASREDDDNPRARIGWETAVRKAREHDESRKINPNDRRNPWES